MESKSSIQVTTTVYHAYFMSLQVMREYKDQGITKHPSIASEYIKFICHNSPFETLDTLDSKIKSIEGTIKEINQKMVVSSKQLNTTMQKADDGKSKLSNIESQVTKLEKNK